MLSASNAPSVIVILHFVVLILAFFLTLPAAFGFARRFVFKTNKQQHEFNASSKFYEDEDGVATEESCKKYSARTPKYLALVSAFVGFGLSVSSGVLYEIQPVSPVHLAYWFGFGAWVSHAREQRPI